MFTTLHVHSLGVLGVLYTAVVHQSILLHCSAHISVFVVCVSHMLDEARLVSSCLRRPSRASPLRSLL